MGRGGFCGSLKLLSHLMRTASKSSWKLLLRSSPNFPDCDSADKIGLICRPTRCALLPCMLIDSTAYNAHASKEVSQVIESITEIVAVVTYGDNELESSKPLLRHGSEEPPKKTIHAGSNMNHVHVSWNWLLLQHTSS